MRAERAIEIQGLLISVDVAAALQARDVVRYSEVEEEHLPKSKSPRAGLLWLWRLIIPY